MSHMIISSRLPFTPSEYESDHLGRVLRLNHYVDEHNALPHNPWVGMLLNHQRINEVRFTHYHPNLEWILDKPVVVPTPPVCNIPIPPVPPVVCHVPVDCNPTPPNAVPEPSSVLMFSIAIAVALLAKWFVR